MSAESLFDKISVLGPDARYDTCGPKDLGKTTNVPGVYHAKVGGNNVCRLFKVLQTNECTSNCTYCALRRDRDCQRASTTPDEMAKAFDTVYSRRLVDGLFLSSGIDRQPDSVMERQIDTANILRKKYDYSGYIHLKLMPGASRNCLAEAMNVANRISVNIEAPTEEDLHRLSPTKQFKSGFFHMLSQVKSEIRRREYAGKKSPSVTTQFVVGAGQEKDRDLIKTTHFLYRNFGLKRVFYAAFQPVPDTPLENRPAASLTREHRLYQADFLMRFYRFDPGDIPLDQDGFLHEVGDPKTIWAQNHPEFFPVNLNHAGYWDLLKVPGIGPTSAKKIKNLRQKSKIMNLSDLENMRMRLDQMRRYICF